ncbi:hypothetical protein E3N88_17046 [Mikania micrantha]|uniref:Uncharacterized protein n=1 Tax=Mikania micrantha TaxID=192012 RepID=A0A5N6NS83_9ASTR|nr:hypothetical protein E3N88_17046 [Mikania micrantha]
MRIALTTKDTQEGQVRFAFEKVFKWRSVRVGSRWHTVDEINRCFEGKMPKPVWNIGLSQECKAGFNDMTMTSFNHAVLFTHNNLDKSLKKLDDVKLSFVKYVVRLSYAEVKIFESKNMNNSCHTIASLVIEEYRLNQLLEIEEARRLRCLNDQTPKVMDGAIFSLGDDWKVGWYESSAEVVGEKYDGSQ